MVTKVNKKAFAIQSMICDIDPSYTSSRREIVKKLRIRLFEWMAHQNPQLAMVLKSHYRERLLRSQGQIMLGEYAVFIISDLLKMSKNTVARVQFPWLMLYEYSLLLDDLLDESRKNFREEILLSQILLDAAHYEFAEFIENSAYEKEIYSKYRMESMYAMNEENAGINKEVTPFSEDMVILQGQKSSLIKYLASSMMFLENNRALSENEEDALGNICSGIQLLDDLTDIEDDHEAGRKNSLLYKTYRWASSNTEVSYLRTDYFDRNILIVAAAYSGAISQSWELASQKIQLGLRQLDSPKSQTSSLLKGLSTSCAHSKIRLETLINSNPHKKFLDKPEILENILYQGPQARN